MNNQAPKPESGESSRPPASTEPRRLPVILRQPGVVLALLALALLAGQWIETRSRIGALEQVLATRLSQGDSVAQEARTLAKQSTDSLEALQRKVGGIEARLGESQSQLMALDSMYQEIARNRDERLLVEVEQTLNIGAQQLHLAGNVESAVAALEAVDARLADASRPQFLALRKAVARDIQKLKSQPSADVPGLSLKIESIILSVDDMPLAFAAEPRPEPKVAQAGKPGFWLALGRELLGEMKQLVRVERLDRPDPGFLTPDHAFLLRENLKLRLVDARLSLLQRDGKNFKDDMVQSRQWIERYFDTRSPSAATALAVLRQLSQADLAMAPPNLNESLAALRSLRTAVDKGAK